jgi:hypothetical protein
MAEGTCGFAGCVKPVRCRGWCSAHYERWRKHGDPSVTLDPVPPPRPPRTQPESCLVDGCAQPPWSRSFCTKHYQKWRKYGDAAADGRRSRRDCKIADCGRRSHGHGLCSRHYQLWRVHGDASWQRVTNYECRAAGCEAKPRSRAGTLCEAHYQRLRRRGSLDPGACQKCSGILPSHSAASRRFCPGCALARRRAAGREAGHRRRVIETAAVSDRIDVAAIYERDRWRCGICRKRVKRALLWPHRMSPSLDHVVPLAEGGLHIRANVRLAHLTCNLSRGARGGGEQLALIG